MNKLRLGPLPKTELVKVTIAATIKLKVRGIVFPLQLGA